MRRRDGLRAAAAFAATALAGVLLLGAPSLAHHALRVTIQELPPLTGDAGSFANDVNARGHAVGSSSVTDAEGNLVAGRAVAWKRGQAHELPMLPGAGYSRAFGNNDRGLVVGESGTLGGLIEAVKWRKGQVAALPTPPGWGNSYASDVNDREQVVGAAIDAAGNRRAVLWRRGEMTDLGVLDGNTQSRGSVVNRGGLVFGDSYSLDEGGNRVENHAVVWRRGRIEALGELPGGRQSGSGSLNDRGVAVGWSLDASGTARAVAWSKGRVTELRTPDYGLSSFAWAVNNRGMIIGAAVVSETEFRTVMWRGEAVIDLNALLPPGSGWANLDPYILNDRGQLVGGGLLNGVPRAFLMTIRTR